jgi:hypothetical protein
MNTMSMNNGSDSLSAKARGLSSGEAIKKYLHMAGVTTTLPKTPFECSKDAGKRSAFQHGNSGE